MARFPRFFKEFAVSDISYPGTDLSYGSDGSENEKYGYTLYIGNDVLKRMILLKGFIESIKMNLSKGREEVGDADTNIKISKEYNGKFSYDIVVNIPAHSVNESRNNTAKLAELSRMIQPVNFTGFSYYDDTQTTRAEPEEGASPLYKNTPIYKNLFSVYFRNLINSGMDYSGIINVNSYDKLYRHGFRCIIDKVSYQPDMEMGFFEFDSFNYPKLLKLNLTLTYETSEKSPPVGFKALAAFNVKGGYYPLESGIFPFLVKVKPDGRREQVLKSYTGGADFTIKQMNELKYNGNRHNSHVFFSLINDKNDGGAGSAAFNPAVDKRTRYVFFKPFIESFERNILVETELKESKDTDLDTIYKDASFDEINYKFKLNIPAMDLNEAKKNCAKIQYLMRMFYKKSPLPTEGETKENIFIKCYIPSKIELPGSEAPARPGQFTDNWRKAVPLEFETLTIDIDMEQGFFEEKGKIYPKLMSIDVSLKLNNRYLLQPYNGPSQTTNDAGQTSYDFDKGIHPVGTDIPFYFTNGNPQPHLFPFNRQYTTLIESPEGELTQVTTGPGTTTTTQEAEERVNDTGTGNTATTYSGPSIE